MIVTFYKSDNGRTCGWEALRSKRRRVPGTTMAAGRDLPHDLAQLVIEATLGRPDGFWGCVAMGATFKSLGRRRTEPGRQVIHDHLDGLQRAEAEANIHYGAWRAGAPTETRPALDAFLERWQTLPRGSTLVVEWPSLRVHEREVTVTGSR
jgi:hypothetical protein